MADYCINPLGYSAFQFNSSCYSVPQGEKNIFLVQFTEPSAEGVEDTISVQRTPSRDVLEYVTGMKHAILPSDKVLAPWEPGRKRYGPGTVLQGLETRDPLRGKTVVVLQHTGRNCRGFHLRRGLTLFSS